MVMINEISSLVRSRGKGFNGPRTRDLVDVVWPEIPIGVRMFSENQTYRWGFEVKRLFWLSLGRPPDVDKLPQADKHRNEALILLRLGTVVMMVGENKFRCDVWTFGNQNYLTMKISSMILFR